MRRARGVLLGSMLVSLMACALENPSTIVPTPDAGPSDVGLVCLGGRASCDGNDSNGCETDLRTSLMHCGACGTRCEGRAMGAASCVEGRCVYTCEAGFGDCDNNPANGCETDLRVSPQHCGSCGRACTAAGAAAVCRNSVCASSNCMAGFGDCDGNADNGCETVLSTSAEHCGMCGARCNLANAAAVCSSGACGILRCNEGFATCDGNAANGCETDLGAVTSCGACGNACPSGPGASAACTAGRCSFACMTGRADCDGNQSNGCEVTLGTVAHCGGCGMACSAPTNGTVQCAAGRCVPSCNANFVLQGGMCVACGGSSQPPCGTSCGAGTVLQNSVCVPCGAATQPVCADGMCNPGQVVRSGTCVPCGAATQPACAGGSCGAGTVNLNGTCTACGAASQPACAGGACNTGFVAQSNVCVACGALGQPPCAGGACNTGLVASSGRCVACGASGQPACANGMCNTGLVLQNGLCSGCGAVGQPSCSGSCTGGLIDCGGVCTDNAHDPLNCGRCASTCTTCTNGSCPGSCGGREGPCCTQGNPCPSMTPQTISLGGGRTACVCR
ncbi:MAG: hypothetical protein JNK72_09140 [Myxococcales bacterium]|nr:hypothetical protein [Myxococcales bacterium]